MGRRIERTVASALQYDVGHAQQPTHKVRYHTVYLLIPQPTTTPQAASVCSHCDAKECAPDCDPSAGTVRNPSLAATGWQEPSLAAMGESLSRRLRAIEHSSVG